MNEKLPSNLHAAMYAANAQSGGQYPQGQYPVVTGSYPAAPYPVGVYPNGFHPSQPYPSNQPYGTHVHSHSPCILTPDDPYTGLSNINMFIIEQQTHMLEAATQGCCEQENEYKIFSNGGRYMMDAREESGCCCRICLHPNHSLKLHIKTPNSDPHDSSDLFTVIKPFKCCCAAFCSCCQKEITVLSHSKGRLNQQIGYVKQPCCGGCCRPKLYIYDRPYGNYLGYVAGPCCCLGGFCDSKFNVHDTHGYQIGKIERKGVKDLASLGRELFTDSDKFTLSFPLNINHKMKVILFSTLLFIDYLFFEEEGNCECNPISCNFHIKCCDIYCCGSTIPCKCKCHTCAGGSGGGEG